ncbi:MAG TPA: hypothetical protein VIS76_00205, partial [Pseudomonadales bacterium]
MSSVILWFMICETPAAKAAPCGRRRAAVGQPLRTVSVPAALPAPGPSTPTASSCVVMGEFYHLRGSPAAQATRMRRPPPARVWQRQPVPSRRPAAA